jgi:hypothetical protein
MRRVTMHADRPTAMGAAKLQGPEQMQADMHVQSGVLRQDSLGMAHNSPIADLSHSRRGSEADASLLCRLPQRQDSFPAIFSPNTPHAPDTPALFTGMLDEGLALFSVMPHPETPRPATLNLLLLDQA